MSGSQRNASNERADKLSKTTNWHTSKKPIHLIPIFNNFLKVYIFLDMLLEAEEMRHIRAFFRHVHK